MESNINDPLAFDDSISDFDPNQGIVVGQAEIILDNSNDQSMDFDQIVDQPNLMETGQEEVVGPDFVEQQFTLGPDGEYTLQDSQPMETVVETTPFATSSSHSTPGVEVQFAPQTNKQAPATTAKAVQGKPHFVAIRPSPAQAPQVQPSPSPLRHIAIAPKPSSMNVGKNFVPLKRPMQSQFATTKLVKKVSLSNVMQAAKGQPVLAQVGKQLIMIPAGGGAQQKIKLMKADGTPIQAQFVPSKPTQKPLMAKVIVQNQPQLGHNIDNFNQSAVLTKLNVGNASFSIASPGNTQSPRFVTVQSKNVSGSLGNNVIMASPSKQIVTKQQVLLGSPQKKPGKKFIITMNPQESPAKPVTPQKTTITKASDASNVHTQIHKINVPGKGIQYIKLVTNKNAQVLPTNVASKPKPPPGKTIVLTDNKGNFIQMIDGKISNQPMVVTSGAASKVMKSAGSVGQPAKLVRIAPVGTQHMNIAQAQPRTQSLLAPSEPPPLAELTRSPARPESIPESILPDHMEPETNTIVKALEDDDSQDYIEEELTDADFQTNEVEISFERQSSIAQDESTHSAEEFSMADLQDDEHPLLVMKPHTNDMRKKKKLNKEDYLLERGLSISQSTLMGAVSPPHESDIPELELRPRKPCNCTKSQCLKLYCDCFANGEFCNNCNCNNCHNNLENEELRQKAIRGCLDRNPNAFRPKIGKSRLGSGGALPAAVRRHNKGCNCKRSGCLKNYCECYEAKIACSSICKCFGCRNVEDSLGRRIDAALHAPRPDPPPLLKQPCSFMTAEVIEAVCQCLVAAAAEPPSPPATPAAPADPAGAPAPPRDPVAGIIEEFARCLQDIVSAAQQGPPVLADGSRT